LLQLDQFAKWELKKVKKEELKVLGIIGIRSGSKGVPDKNIKLLNGLPLVAWALNAAKGSSFINRLVVSTDSHRYAEVVQNYGAEVPYLRPAALSNDFSPEIDYVIHMIKWLEVNEGYRPDYVVRMMATSPFQMSEDIDAVMNIMINDPSADSAVIIAEARQHPLKALKLIEQENDKKKLVTYFSESGREVTPIARQNYEKAYFRANVIAVRSEVIFETNSLTGDEVRYHLIPQDRAIDIDNEIDFKIAEYIMSCNGSAGFD
jgi:CMP-N-acetylneuraminic acid synthetase